MNFEFSNPYRIFVSLFLIGTIIFFYQKYPVAIPFLYAKLGDQKKTYKRLLLHVIPFFLFFILSLLLAGPSFVTKQTKEIKQARQFVIALDISYSMNADDMQPNRLEVAKQTIKNLLDQFQGDQIGLVLFAGKPFVSIPLSFDLDAIKQMITQYSTETINQQNPALQGTAIGDAILASLSLLENQGSSSLIKEVPKAEDSQSIILITDGSANVGIDPLLAAKYAANSGIYIYTLGIGSATGGSLPLQTAFGIRRQQVEGVDAATLSEIAKISGGLFARINNEQEFQKALHDISEIKKMSVAMTTIQHYRPLNTYLIAIAFFLLVYLLYASIITLLQLKQSTTSQN